MYKWFVGDDEAFSDFMKEANDKPELSQATEQEIKRLALLSLFLACLIWPVELVEGPFNLIRNKLKEKKHEN